MSAENTYTYILVIALAWLFAHLIKAIIEVKKGTRKQFFDNFFASGGMPSAHTATVMGLTTLIGLNLGIYSPVFALATLFAAITMHDAMRVRYQTGENSLAINKVIEAEKLSISKIRVHHGHTKKEVVYGAILGAVLGVIVYFVASL